MPQAGLSVRRVDAPRTNSRNDEDARRLAAPDPSTRPREGGAATPRPAVPGAGVPGRRTITIQGRGAERYTPSSRRRRPARRPHERAGFKPDRAAMWAVLLGILLVLVAATSSHAAVIGGHGPCAVHALVVPH